MDTRSVNELYHYGVKGMKWGVRRAAVGMAAVGIVGAGLTSDYIRNNPASAVANIYNRYRR